MQDKIEALAKVRRLLKDEQDNLSTIEAEIEAAFGERLKLAKAQLGTAKADVQHTEGLVRTAALDLYTQDGNKRPHPAVQIKVYTAVKYDQSAAKALAVEYIPDALKLDKRAFEKAAKELAGMNLGEVTDRLREVVTMKGDPRATIARDLGGY